MMTDYNEIESHQRQHHYEMEHRERMYSIVEESRIRQINHLITDLNLTPFKDGDEWCFLIGDNIMEGVSGFGKYPFQAASKFYNNWHGINPAKRG